MNLKIFFGASIIGLLSLTACNNDYLELKAPQSIKGRFP